MSNLLILFVVGGSIAAIITTVIRILHDLKSPTEVLNMIEGVDKGIMTVNKARTKAGFETINEFQKAAHDFGDTTKSEAVGGSTIRKVSYCPNCGANLTQNGVCVYCGTYYE